MKKILVILVIFSIKLFSQNSVNIVGPTKTGDDFQKTGSAGGQFLKIGPGARGNGMGGAFSSVANDLSAIHWNPAGVASVEGIQTYFAYSTWFSDFQQNYVAVSAPINKDFNVSVHFNSFGVQDIPVTTINQPDGTGAFYSVNDMSFGVGLHGYLTEQFSFGAVVKFVQNSFQNVSAGGFAFDLGTMYDTQISGIRLGFSIHNLNADRSFEGTPLQAQSNRINPGGGVGPDNGSPQAPIGVNIPAWPFTLPMIFRAGISKVFIDDEVNYLIVATDFITMSDAPEQFAIGADYSWNDIISLRGGYYYGNDQLGVTGGVGLKYYGGKFNGNLEYAINPTTNFGIINRLNLALNF